MLHRQQAWKMAKVRIDVLLVEKGVAPTRQKAQAMLLAGAVLVDDRPVDKPGTLVSSEAVLRIRGNPIPYVSRGGLKLEHALDHFRVDPAGLRVLDAGISTGGFTDCLLKRGAAHVYGVDVGKAQVAWEIRQNPAVTLFEGLNIRELDVAALGDPVDLVVADLSFIRRCGPAAPRCPWSNRSSKWGGSTSAARGWSETRPCALPQSTRWPGRPSCAVFRISAPPHPLCRAPKGTSSISCT
jgi:hypothetical protein